MLTTQMCIFTKKVLKLRIDVSINTYLTSYNTKKIVMEVLPVINNVTCLSKGGSVSVQASGGVAPYSYPN